MATNGERQLVINPSERAVSTDIMRLQTFKETDINELWRQVFSLDNSFDDQGGAVGTVDDVLPSTVGTPLSGDVVGGLLVRPQSASLNLLVDPGVAFVVSPDSPQNPDESVYRYVRDVGVQTLGALVLGANASGQVRVDVIECGLVSGGFNVVETDNRDVFNPVSGLFSAATVNKVTAGALQYRVRAGTPGGGFPGVATGWMPLCVAVVPNGTTTCSQVMFYDVRPLVADRARAPFRAGSLYGNRTANCANELSIDTSQSAGEAILYGHVEAQAYDATNTCAGVHRLGGAILNVDLNNAANQSGSMPAAGAVYVYLVEPFGLPRWVGYRANELPASPRGIPLVSSIAPLGNGNGAPSAALALPATGYAAMGGSATQGVCVAASITLASLVQSVLSDGRTQWAGFVAGWNGPIVGSTVGSVITWTATPGSIGGGTLGYPSNARSITVDFALGITSVAANTSVSCTPSVEVVNTGTGFTIAAMNQTQVVAANPTAAPDVGRSFNFRCRIPIPAFAEAFKVEVNCPAIGMNVCAATVVGWDL